jgi:hypothetical protein
MISRTLLQKLSRARSRHTECLMIAPRMVRRKYRAGKDTRCDLCLLTDRILDQEIGRLAIAVIKAGITGVLDLPITPDQTVFARTNTIMDRVLATAVQA